MGVEISHLLERSSYLIVISSIANLFWSDNARGWWTDSIRTRILKKSSHITWSVHEYYWQVEAALCSSPNHWRELTHGYLCWTRLQLSTNILNEPFWPQSLFPKWLPLVTANRLYLTESPLASKWSGRNSLVNPFVGAQIGLILNDNATLLLMPCAKSIADKSESTHTFG